MADGSPGELKDKFKDAVHKVQGGGADDSPTIKVCVRLRPFIKEEIEGERSGGKCELCIAMPTRTRVEMIGREDPRSFDFDRCFWSHSSDHPLYATQETLQEELGETLLEHAMNGFNNCIFAYGQTGSGKSFSVLGGSGDARGLLPRVVEGLFNHFAMLPEGSTCKTLVAFIEIYNEEICDLLASRDPHGKKDKDKKLDIKQHPVLGTIIQGLTEAAVGSCEEVLQLVEYGTTMRHVSATKMNASSSRSHCIFTFKTSVSHGEGTTRMSQTHLVDLAGSERAARTKATGDRLKEGAAINQSLSTLARVISELAKKKKKGNPPFRDSKLTYILKESLCGNSKTVMMAAISPSSIDYDETLSTLKFAQSVKQVQTKAVANRVSELDIEAKLRRELEQLRSELEQLRSGERLSRTGPLDDERASLMERRLREQEQLCAWFGKDWDSLLAEERNRMRRRTAHLNQTDMTELQRRIASLAPVTEEGSSSSDSDSDSSEDESEDGMACPLLHLEEDTNEGGVRSSLVTGSTSSIVVNGLAAMGMNDGGPARAEALTKELRQCRSDAAAAERLVRELSGPGALQLKLTPVAIIFTEDHPIKAGIYVHVVRAAGEGTDSHAVSDEGEFLSRKDLHLRLNFLQGLAAIQRGKTLAATRSGGDAWVAAAAATGERHHEQSQHLQPPGAGAQDRRLAEEALARSQREAGSLREEAAALQKACSEMRDLCDRLTTDKVQADMALTAEARKTEKALQELAEARAALANAHGRFAGEEARSSDELRQTRGRLEAAQEEAAKLRGRLTSEEASAAERRKAQDTRHAEEAQRLRGQVNAAQEEAATLRGRLAGQEAHNAAEARASEELRELRGQLASAREEAARLRGRLAAEEAAVAKARAAEWEAKLGVRVGLAAAVETGGGHGGGAAAAESEALCKADKLRQLIARSFDDVLASVDDMHEELSRRQRRS